MEQFPRSLEANERPAVRLFEYIRALVESSRPHFFAFPVGAVLAGIATSAGPVAPWRILSAMVIAGCGWGVGQLLNDVLDREADAIDAPHRASVQGLLPTKPTIMVALIVGLSLASGLIWLTPAGVELGVASMLLIVSYNKFKSFPFGGNLSHAAVMSLAALVGMAIADPTTPLLNQLISHHKTLSVVGTWAGLYLQGNYEKDMAGDAAAGYRTAAHLFGVRWSSWIRVGVAPLCLAYALPLLTSPLALIVGGLSAGLIMVSAAVIGHAGDSVAALRWYRATVHGGTLGMLAFGAGSLSLPIFLMVALSAGFLTEAAFQRSPNP